MDSSLHLTLCVISLPLALVFAADDPVFIYPDVFNDPERDAFMFGKFPKGFIWSAATSSYQIEGAWDVGGKGESIWDRYAHTPGNIANDDNGDVACDSYNKYKQDVQLMVDMGLKYYRFSLSWPRLLPDGTLNNPSADGLRYYNDLIDELVANDISPMITLYHWDLPQALQDFGGWVNESIVEHFNKYANYCFQNFGDRAKLWITFNEPWIFTMLGYGCGEFPPGICEDGTTTYVVAHNIIKSHAHAWHTYDDDYRAKQNGQIGITLPSDFIEPFDRSDPADIDAAERSLQFGLGWFAHPIYINGDYPEVMKTKVAYKSTQQGYNVSRLPEFTEDEKAFIKGTGDFFGLNHYSTSYAVDVEEIISDPPSYYNDQDLDLFKDEKWPDSSGSSWLKVVPWGFRQLLNWVDQEYQVPIYITENGISTKDVYELNDVERVKYHLAYINEVLKAINDGADVRGYAAWTLMDNFAFAAGYTERFGMHYVDFSDPDRKREPKESSNIYARIVAENGFDEDWFDSRTVTVISYLTLSISYTAEYRIFFFLLFSFFFLSVSIYKWSFAKS
ncbi:cytosolic beta-glucosidase-like [Amphiura filiformis]|uniref:cytosolic beta-glucosidase-like n=1 Tax=Amphiura filiformis TaxID=82378 RepID=UPI003B21D35C